MLASRGHKVIGVDVKASVVEAVNNGKPHFDEPDLQMLLSAAVNTGQLVAQSTPSEADHFIIAVPTPFTECKRPDLTYIDAACQALAPCLRNGSNVILESTSPVGTTERLSRTFATLRPDLTFPAYQSTVDSLDVTVSHCPERILPGQIVRELVCNDRVIGGVDRMSTERTVALYETFCRGAILETDCRTAEFVKLIENAFRDVNIAFANELSLICEDLGIDVWRAISFANKHPRVNILDPGPGVGGHCIAVDPWFIVDSAPTVSRLIRTAREVNDAKPRWVVEQIQSLACRLKHPTIACYGLTYKADVEDIRESPALEIVRELASDPGVEILICDPYLRRLPVALEALDNVRLVDAGTARTQSDVVAFLVAHKQFRKFDPSLFLNKMVVDVVALLGERRPVPRAEIQASDASRHAPARRMAFLEEMAPTP
jgi:UDP-N-acetyl-D-mannosaminuronic acid dehydrogenase